jgi:hypothetical protein
MSHTPNGRSNSQDVQKRADASGRDAQGRFGPGNPGGPGNPFARKVAELRSAFLNAISKEEMREIVRLLVAEARLGDKAAIKIVLQYGIGKPAPAASPDRVDHDEWRLLKGRPSYDDIMAQEKRMDFRHAWAFNRQWDHANDQRTKDLITQQLLEGDKKPSAEPKAGQG